MYNSDISKCPFYLPQSTHVLYRYAANLQYSTSQPTTTALCWHRSEEDKIILKSYISRQGPAVDTKIPRQVWKLVKFSKV